ncbi:helix-turn-helix domain-containing protein [Pseudomonas sp. SIMBA_041]|nr:helix-turn-helix domain-containing protein [Pseudomonas mucoides]
MRAAGGNISHLARRLGVSRNTLYKRLRQAE